ncbi:MULTISPECIES: DUF3363 domain-containing protein [Bradyrhizobium]|uniref:DUF3363 domain-containing protein n=1 Tax=Bradyrhizobium archetypum TaxID=2721160 RepID=A0A7Y4H9H3_9BRAD|nr:MULTISPECIES: DUF3363 domain-containing protein [Bradyrhizobium]MCA6115035.1 DUF3363 domain-containing protein [Bradyrhizobium hereditatis]NOJ50139.1 DUF3363 domain-containing protein [Bradyrhizobium archetypum]
MANAKFKLVGAEVRAALERLIDVLADLGLAYRQGDKVKLGRNLIESLQRELDTIGRGLAEEMGLAHYPLMQVSRLRGSIADRLSHVSLRLGMIDH